MADYDNTNRGVLFHNDKKETENHPNYKGSVNVDGTEYWLSGWVKKNEDGSFKLMSLSVQPKDEVREAAQKTGYTAANFDTVAEVPDEPINLDDIPF